MHRPAPASSPKVSSGSASSFWPNSQWALLLGALLPPRPAAVYLRGSGRVPRWSQLLFVRWEQSASLPWSS